MAFKSVLKTGSVKVPSPGASWGPKDQSKDPFWPPKTMILGLLFCPSCASVFEMCFYLFLTRRCLKAPRNRSAVATQSNLQHGSRMPSDSCYATPSAPRNRSAVATETSLQHGSRMPSDSCYATLSAPRNRSAAFRECSLFLLCRLICRFICSLPGSTFASCSASREHGPRSQKKQETPKPGARQDKRITTCQENAETKTLPTEAIQTTAGPDAPG